MQGIKMKKLYELISHNHEAEFMYNDTTFILQPEINNDKAYLVIWDCTPDTTKCIAKHEIDDEKNISQSTIDAILSEKCFNGKSFKEISNEIIVTVIY